MSADTAVVEISRHFDVSPETLFDAWFDPGSVRHWLFATPGGTMERIEIDARVGGRFLIAERRGADLAEHFGEYVEIDRPHRLAFEFWTSFSAERTRITITIAPDGEGSLLTLTHEGVWADFEDRTRQGWTMILESLARALT
jgi:uncharacterized protein YndB with AHSA1/START domain